MMTLLQITSGMFIKQRRERGHQVHPRWSTRALRYYILYLWLLFSVCVYSSIMFAVWMSLDEYCRHCWRASVYFCFLSFALWLDSLCHHHYCYDLMSRISLACQTRFNSLSIVPHRINTLGPELDTHTERSKKASGAYARTYILYICH